MDSKSRVQTKHDQYRRYSALIILIILTGIGSAFSLKAAVGVGSWDALTLTISFFVRVKVGTVGMILNILCVLGQILLLKKEFKWINLLQIPVSILLGTVVNFFLYDILSNFTIDSYLINVLLLIGSYVYLSIIVGTIMTLDLITFSLEGFCMAIANKTNQSFGKVRQIADILCIVIVFLLALAFSLPLSVREGTVISMLIFGPLLSFFMPKIEILVKKWRLVDN